MKRTPIRPGKGFGRRRQPVKRANRKRREWPTTLHQKHGSDLTHATRALL